MKVRGPDGDPATGLPRDSVLDVTGLVTLHESELAGRVGVIPSALQEEVDRGLRRVPGP